MRLATVWFPRNPDYTSRSLWTAMDGGRWRTHMSEVMVIARARTMCGALSRRRRDLALVPASTLYAFSRDNWSRPQAEVNNIMALLRTFLETEGERCRREGVRIQVIGSRDKLEYSLLRSIAAAERQTARGTGLDLRIALNYSSRDSILAAARRCIQEKRKGINGVSNFLAGDGRRAAGVPDVDLLVRTGGEQRLSDFLLWECAYAELYFTPVLWPDFAPRDLEGAIAEFKQRERRFGNIRVETGTGKDYWLR